MTGTEQYDDYYEPDPVLMTTRRGGTYSAEHSSTNAASEHAIGKHEPQPVRWISFASDPQCSKHEEIDDTGKVVAYLLPRQIWRNGHFQACLVTLSCSNTILMLVGRSTRPTELALRVASLFGAADVDDRHLAEDCTNRSTSANTRTDG